ncbi:MAG: HsdR family type I site-specific deoxyribonuclease [Ruminococcaceae bacterium]|nr:HsdR family type I site-specific deoxyribonuclease [Oscillospiraceae bacterium]
MPQINAIEKVTQKRVINFFVDKLHYTYIGDLHDRENSNIMQEALYAYLTGKGGYSDKLARRAIDELVRTAGDLQHGLYDANKEVYRLLKYGAKVVEEAGESPKNVFFIDFDDISKNDFTIAEEVTVVGENTKRPDLVIYVNGIALAVIELKRSSVSVAEGIRQNLTNQDAHFIEKFFTTMQFCMAGNDSEGLRYGTLLTPEKHYYEWKDDGFAEFSNERSETDVLIEEKSKEIENLLDRQIFAMFYKKRFLDLIHNFIIFDKGIKKVCRYNQYYALKRAQHRLTEEKRGGIIWHTQGSGKTLSMIWLSKWILANNPNARVLIVTDREELDDQIEKAYKGVDENIVRTKSGKDLVSRINAYDDRLICSLIHKFGKRGGEATGEDYQKYIEELLASLPKDYSAKGEFVIFVDECHRTQSGKLHVAMKTIIPDGIFVGFTGTPLLKKDKKTSLETFGGYIHTYKFDEAVRDKVVLDLRYEFRDVPQEIKSQDKIDAWFDIKTKGLSPRAKAKLKSMWATMQKVFSSRSRLEKIALDIQFDFETKARLMDGNGNAMLVAGSVYSACKYYEIFQQIGFKKCAIITSYEPQAGDLRTDTVSDEEETETFEKYEIYQKMLGGQSVEDFEKEAKRKFVNEPYNMKLLIVVDKLLTGFDAPPCTYLYIDKAMHDHGLFQAICRVNRLDGDSKDFGYIVDYKQLFGDLADAINTYTAGAFEDYDAEDVAGLLKDRTEEAKKYFYETLDALDELCEGVEMPRAELDYIHYFCGENGVDNGADEAFARSREKLYKLVSRLVRAFAEFKPRMDDAGIPASEQSRFDDRVNMYIKLRDVIGRASGDFLDFKQFEPGMRYLIDNYIVADDAEKLAIFDDFTLLDFILAQEENLSKGGKEQQSAAEAIENNIQKKVVQKLVINPIYYNKMSEALEKLMLERRKGVLNYKELLNRYLELAKKVNAPEENEHYPESVRKSGAMRAFYDNCGEDEQLAIRLHKAVLSSKMDGFRNNPTKENRIKRELYKILKDEDTVERLYKIIVEQEEY